MHTFAQGEAGRSINLCGSLHCVVGTAVVSRTARPQGPPGTTGAQDMIARNCSTKGTSTGRRRVVRWRNVNQAPISQRTVTRAARAYSPIRIPEQRFDGREPHRIEHGQWVQDHRGGARHMGRFHGAGIVRITEYNVYGT